MSHRFLSLAIALSAGLSVAVVGALDRPAGADGSDPALVAFHDESGQVRTLDVNGPLDLTNPFFQELGTNGRSCFSCHRPAQGWTITPESVQQRFDETAGLDPIFRNNDGSNCEGADISTRGKRRKAFSLLLDRGLIRVGLDMPPQPEFVIDSVDDPYECGAPLTGVSA